MSWQDITIMVGCFALGFALFPSIFSKYKPARWSCALTFGVLLVLSICFATLKLWLSMGAELFATVCWFILLVQKRG